jgi:hypothetical protein
VLHPFGRRRVLIALAGVSVIAAGRAIAQDNYEIQVYGSATVAPATTMVELHSNFTADGRRTEQDGLWPTEHAEHETLEITHGFTSWFEVGSYLFTSVDATRGWQWVGDHIRPRVRAPESWGLPVGLSLSAEIGYQRRQVSTDTWTWEIRPIVDQQIGRLYWSINPALERSFTGPGVSKGFEFAPNAAVGVDVTRNRKFNLALEYYGALGSVGRWDPYAQQQHQLFLALNVDFGPAWEFNAGVGNGWTAAADHVIIKTILGRRLPF